VPQIDNFETDTIFCSQIHLQIRKGDEILM
jgi:hypothetical protein